MAPFASTAAERRPGERAPSQGSAQISSICIENVNLPSSLVAEKQLLLDNNNPLSLSPGEYDKNSVSGQAE